MKIKDLIEYLADSDEKAEVIVYGLYPSDKTLGCAEIAIGRQGRGCGINGF